MAQPYYDELTTLVKRHMSGCRKLECKHFFSGAALYANRAICVSLSPVGLACKLPEQMCFELLASGVGTHLRYFEKSPVKKGYVLFPKLEELTDRAVAKYLEAAISHVCENDV